MNLYCSGMIRDDKETFLKLLNDMISKKDVFLNLMNSFEEEELFKGIQIVLDEIDADNYGYDVHKWLVDFEPTDVDSVIVKVTGYYRSTEYFLINQITGQEVFKSIDIDEANRFVENMEDADFIQQYECWQYRRIDRIKNWTKDIPNITFIYEPWMVEEDYEEGRTIE